MVPVDQAGVVLHMTVLLHALLTYVSDSTKMCIFPSAGRWLQTQHTLSSPTSAMEKVTYSKGTRQTESSDTASPAEFISLCLPEHFDALGFGSKQSLHQGESKCREPPSTGIFNISPFGHPWHQAPRLQGGSEYFPQCTFSCYTLPLGFGDDICAFIQRGSS